MMNFRAQDTLEPQPDRSASLGSAPATSNCTSSQLAVISTALQRLDSWLESQDFAGYDPFEGLSSNLRPLTLGSKFLRQCLVQFVRRCPFNIRPLLGIHPSRSSKGMGFLARGYLRWNAIQPDATLQRKAQMCLEWLMEHSSKGYSGYCWGNHFDYQTRAYYAAAGTPTIVWSSLIGMTFVEAFECTGDSKYLDIARSTCDFVMNDLARIPGRVGFCFSYVPVTNVVVHNSNVLGAALLARVFRHTGESELKRTAHSSIQFTASHQNSDGSWFYGPGRDMHWIDNWHTAYVLEAFDLFSQSTSDTSFDPVCRKGWEFYRKNFFLSDGTPKYYYNKTWPIDIQCASQSIETLCRFHAWAPDSLELATKVALWTIANMQDADGHFYYQRRRFWTNKTATLHWGQSTTLSALATLIESHRNA